VKPRYLLEPVSAGLVVNVYADHRVQPGDLNDSLDLAVDVCPLADYHTRMMELTSGVYQVHEAVTCRAVPDEDNVLRFGQLDIVVPHISHQLRLQLVAFRGHHR